MYACIRCNFATGEKNPHRVIGTRTHEPNLLLRRIWLTKVIYFEVK